MSASAEKKLILVIGATGAQGLAIIDALLAPKEDGTPSPYAVRGLTRDPNSRRAKELAEKGVELVEGEKGSLISGLWTALLILLGSFMDFAAVKRAMTGVYGAWVNLDSFVVGEMRETYAGIRIFETAVLVGTVKHYIWSGLYNVGKV